MRIEQRIAEAIRQNNMSAYQDTRYPEIQEGEAVVFIDENFEEVDFSKFILGFFKFRNCNLDKSRGLNSQPIIIENCSAKNLDLIGCYAVIEAFNSDFRDMKYDSVTTLGTLKKDGTCSSRFVDCKLDEKTIEHFSAQGVEFVSNKQK